MRPVVAAKLSFVFFLIVLSASEFSAVELARAQVITSGNATIDPTSQIHLKGQFPYGGKIKIRFNQGSAVAFSNGSKNDLYLDYDTPPNATSTEIKSRQRIDEASPIGDVPGQKVDISVVLTIHGGANRVSNTWSANFQNKAVIVNGPATVGYNTSFNLSGWDFGAPGKLKIHFTNNSYGSASLDDKSDLKAIADLNWSHGWVINAKTPEVSGLIEQPIEISFITKDGRTSNIWPAKFQPRMTLQPVFWQDVQVISCSNDGAGNGCNANASGICFVPSLVGFGAEGPVYSVQGAHIGCWGLSSDDGTDQYWVNVNSHWEIVSIESYPPATDNSSAQYNYQPDPLPSHQPNANLFVHWHVGATGGAVEYFANFMVKGPYGVPYNP